MTDINLMNPTFLKQVLDEIKNDENVVRKKESIRQTEIFSDRFYRFVKDYLIKQYGSEQAENMPIIACINLAKRIIKKEAGIYLNPPKRRFTNLTPDQTEVVLKWYKVMKANHGLLKSNQLYKLQNQNLLQVLVKKKKPKLRLYKSHQYDVVPDPDSPEDALMYIINTFDRADEYTQTEVVDNGLGQNKAGYSDLNNQAIGDKNDFYSLFERYVIWTAEQNFIADKKMNPLQSPEEAESPIAEFDVMPFIDIADPLEKDHQYFVRNGSSACDATIQYNSHWSSLWQTVDLQSFAVAWAKGPAEALPEKLTVGPNRYLRLITDQNTGTAVEFGFESPNADIGGSKEVLEMFLKDFLISKGLDPKSLAGEAQRATSGFDRMLMMIDEFKPSQEDFDLYQDVEAQLYNLIKVWHNSLRDDDMLGDEYKTTELPEDSELIVEFSLPDAIESKQEKLDNFERERDLGLASRLDQLMSYHGLSEEEAEKLMEVIDESEPEPPVINIPPLIPPVEEIEETEE
jgi:hypothetical protein